MAARASRSSPASPRCSRSLRSACRALPVVTLGLARPALAGRGVSARAPRRSGFAFGLGLFGAGASWVYIALNTFGGMPLPLAAIGTAGFCAFLALYPAAVGWLAVKWTRAGSWPRALAAAARGRLPSGRAASSSPASPGSRSVTRRCPEVRRIRWPAMRRSAACSWCRSPTRSPPPRSRWPSTPRASAARARFAALAGAIVVIVAGGAALCRVEWTCRDGAPRSRCRSSRATSRRT